MPKKESVKLSGKSNSSKRNKKPVLADSSEDVDMSEDEDIQVGNSGADQSDSMEFGEESAEYDDEEDDGEEPMITAGKAAIPVVNKANVLNYASDSESEDSLDGGMEDDEDILGRKI